MSAWQVAFDCTCLTEARTGVGNYTYQLLEHMLKLNGKAKDSCFAFTAYVTNRLSPSLPRPMILVREPQRIYLFFRSRKLDAFFNAFALPRLLKEHVLFHATNYLVPEPLLKSPIKKVVTVHDLSTHLYPDFFPKKMLSLEPRKRASAQHASWVIAVSSCTKEALTRHWEIPAEKISVIYPGVNREWLNGKEVRPKAIPPEVPYILYVGTLEPRKNVERLVEAFSKLSQKNTKLFLVGKKGWLVEPLFKKIEKLKLQGRLYWLNYVSEEELLFLYRHALFFVYPSLYEGFGLPVLEAMACGCPVITSNSSSLPEVTKDAALFVSPEDTSSIQQAMEKLLEDEELRLKLREKGFSRANAFSWEKAAKQTLSIYRQLLQIG